MKQYLELAQKVLDEGTFKPAARENMPSTISLFGAQFRHKLSDGFPLLTTKKINFKNVVTELLWFMKGDTNIKYLVDNGCNIWNEDAYNYYKKLNPTGAMLFEEFVQRVKVTERKDFPPKNKSGYILGDCGKQYGWLWRSWEKFIYDDYSSWRAPWQPTKPVDQLSELIEGLKTNPMSRRHIITAWNPATLDDMALNACHSFVQFNCRPVPFHKVAKLLGKNTLELTTENIELINKDWENSKLPKYYLDCQLYQRSADLMLGVPYNIASYSLLIHIICKITNMIPGDFIHTFGDVHIYEDHVDAIKEQLSRTPDILPNLYIYTEFWLTETHECGVGNFNSDLDALIQSWYIEDFQFKNYNPQSSIKVKLSTGLK